MAVELGLGVAAMEVVKVDAGRATPRVPYVVPGHVRVLSHTVVDGTALETAGKTR
jgi:hypothetical protein